MKSLGLRYSLIVGLHKNKRLQHWHETLKPIWMSNWPFKVWGFLPSFFFLIRSSLTFHIWFSWWSIFLLHFRICNNPPNPLLISHCADFCKKCSPSSYKMIEENQKTHNKVYNIMNSIGKANRKELVIISHSIRTKVHPIMRQWV